MTGNTPAAKFVYSSVTPKFKRDSTDIDHLECWVHTKLVGQDQSELYARAKDLAASATKALDLKSLLVRAEGFISGFEDDPLQEGIAELLTGIRHALREVE